MKKIKINDTELQIDDGVEVTLDSEGNIKISTKTKNNYYPIQYPTITSTEPQISYNIAWYSSSANTNDKQILHG